MANTFTQIHIHTVFAVKHRAALIDPGWRDELFRYITGIIQGHGHKMLAIGGMPDHLHIFFGMRPTQSLSDLMQDVKACSSEWINNKKLVKGRFAWQSGFGAFSYAQSQVPRVIHYILNQEQHHTKKTFAQEYQQLLDKFEVSYDERYLFVSPI
jgi:REP element-mobilizing transposase RayT